MNEPKVRPLDVPPPPRDRRVTAAVAAVAIAVVGVVALGMLARPSSESTAASTTTVPPTTVPALGEGAPQVTTTTTTTTTLAPTLADLIGRRATLAVLTRIGTASGQQGDLALWPAAARAPLHIPLDGRPDLGAFDASGEFVAFIQHDDGIANPGVLYVGARDVGADPQVIGATSARWHDLEPGRLAWVEVRPDAERAVLVTAEVRLGESTVRNLVDVVGLPADTRIMAWGPWGFAIEQNFETLTEGDGTLLTILDPAGIPVVQTPAQLRATAPGVERKPWLLESSRAAYEAFLDEGGDVGLAPDVPVAWPPEDTVVFATRGPSLENPVAHPEIDPGAELAVHPTGAWAVEVAVFGRRTSVTTIDLTRGGPPRITGFDDPHRLLGYSADGSTVLLWSPADPRPLRLLEWRTGASRTVPVFLDGPNLLPEPVAVDLR